MKLSEWNAARRAPYMEMEPVPGEPGWTRYVRHEPPAPKPYDMPECERCGTHLVDLHPGEMLTSFPPQAWCRCPVCNDRNELRVW